MDVYITTYRIKYTKEKYLFFVIANSLTEAVEKQDKYLKADLDIDRRTIKWATNHIPECRISDGCFGLRLDEIE